MLASGGVYLTPLYMLMSLKVIHFQSIFLIDFYLKNTNLCAEMWNNSQNCLAAENSRERGIFAVEGVESG